MGEITAVLWDFGGVILSSPFEAFARYEREHGLPEGLIRRINATDPDTNAWARLERSEVDLAGFCELFEAEAAGTGHQVDGREVIGLLAGEVRPQMVEALRRIRARPLTQAMLTNNFVSRPGSADDGAAGRAAGRGARGEVLDLFDVIVESSQVGVRKPDVRFYELACEKVGVRPEQAVFLDDLGVNLKPARAMGMTTIKVIDPDEALAELEQVLGFPLR